MKEYTETCAQYDLDKAEWTRTVYVTEKERLMKEYEDSLKSWMDLYGSMLISFPTLSTPLLHDFRSTRSISVPNTLIINGSRGDG